MKITWRNQFICYIKISATDIKISDLTLNTNEVPAVDFDGENVLLSAFGAVMDIRQMVGAWDNQLLIDLNDD